MTMMSSREFNIDRSKAKRLADEAPVIITDRGKPSHVLLSYDEYTRLTGKKRSIAEMLSMASDDDIDFEPARLEDFGFRPAEFD